jgi:hypothetical protein
MIVPTDFKAHVQEYPGSRHTFALFLDLYTYGTKYLVPVDRVKQRFDWLIAQQ